MADAGIGPMVHAELGAYAHAVRRGPLLFISGQVPVTPAGESLPFDDLEGQARQVFENLGAVLAGEGCSFADIASLTTYVRDIEDAAVIAAVRSSFLGDARPSSTVVGAVQFLQPQWRLEVQAIAATLDSAQDRQHG